jgi:hypothetical protein
VGLGLVVFGAGILISGARLRDDPNVIVTIVING